MESSRQPEKEKKRKGEYTTQNKNKQPWSTPSHDDERRDNKERGGAAASSCCVCALHCLDLSAACVRGCCLWLWAGWWYGQSHKQQATQVWWVHGEHAISWRSVAMSKASVRPTSYRQTRNTNSPMALISKREVAGAVVGRYKPRRLVVQLLLQLPVLALELPLPSSSGGASGSTAADTAAAR